MVPQFGSPFLCLSQVGKLSRWPIYWRPVVDVLRMSPCKLQRNLNDWANSIREETFPAEETSSIQRRIPSVIPIVNTPITQQYTLMCNNCNERPMAKQTFCFPDWCNKCDESLWSTREMHWQANPTPCSSLSEAINKTALCHESIYIDQAQILEGEGGLWPYYLN